MAKSKLTLTLDELHTPEVDLKVRQQAALATAQANTQRLSALPSPLPMPGSEPRSSIWYNTLVNMTLFGLLGGLLAWGCGELVHHFNPDQDRAALRLMQGKLELIHSLQAGRLSFAEYKGATRIFDEDGRGNPYYEIYCAQLPDDQRHERLATLRRQDSYKTLFADICFYSACGTMIAICLGMAESVAGRNFQGAIVYGAVGAALGLVGGFVVSLFANKLYHMIGGGDATQKGAYALLQQIFARSMSWGVLGLFLSAAPGVVMRNNRKLFLGLLGGLIGGIIGGALFDPLARLPMSAENAETLSRLVAITAIGVITGLATGLIENATKSGWLKVIEGLIAGKQFILYRNPTFIGSAPQCEVYLFKDKRVGRRHAAMHIMEGGYDIEDLGTGGMTIVNGKAIARVRLRSNDKIQIGSTCFLFQEKDRHEET